MKLNIVLYQPEIPQNTGNIARSSAALGATLHLIAPLGFSVSDRYLKRAGLDYWEHCEVKLWDDAKAFFAEHPPETLWFLTKKAQRLYVEIPLPEEPPQSHSESQLWLVFGRETSGLPDSLLDAWPDRCFRIPTRPTVRSLNLSNAVAIVAWDVYRRAGYSGLQCDA